MTLILLDGLEDKSSLTTAAGTTGPARNGNGLVFGNIDSATFTLKAVDESDTVTMGAAVKMAAFTNAPAPFVFLSDAGTVYHILIFVDTTGAVGARRGFIGGTNLGNTAAGLITANTWFYLEAQVKLHDTTGFVTIRVNGTQVLSLSSVDTKNVGTKTTIDTAMLSSISRTSGVGAPITFDDFYVLSGTDSFLGDVTIETLYPNANGAVNQWVGSDGDSVNNYLLVNEVGAPNMVTHTKSSTVNQVDQYNLDNLAHTSGSILGVCHQATVGLAAAGAQTFQLMNRRSVDTVSPALAATSTAYGPFHYALRTDPEGGSWTVTNVNALQTGIKVFGGTDVLLEPFNDFTTNAWTLGSNQTIVAGRTGTGASSIGSSVTVFARYSIPAVNQSAYLTIGFAFRINNASGSRSMFRLESDAGATSHIYVSIPTDGSVEIRLGPVSGTVLATAAAGTIPINTYVYVELAAFLHDTAGFVVMRVNGTNVASAFNIDTKNAGTKTVFDSVCLLGPNSGITNIFDDLYVTMGAASFKGSITIP